MSPHVEASLDVARVAAAIYVVLHHVSTAMGLTGLPALLFRFGQEGVIVFFLLSGFVIYANERDRVDRPVPFFIRRIRRIYPVLLVALGVSVLVAWDAGTLASDFDLGALVGTVVGVQDVSALKPGVITDPFLGNDPLWSLSYELAFYAAFPFVIGWARRHPRRADHVIGATCLASYVVFVVKPNHWALITAYFQIWWCGAMAADRYQTGLRQLRHLRAPLLWLLALAMASGSAAALIGPRGLGVYPVLPFRHFAFAALAVAVAFGPVGAWLARRAILVAGPASACAAVSYGIYAFHFPLLVAWPRAQSFEGGLVAAGLVVMLAWVFDLRLSRWLAQRRRRDTLRPVAMAANA